MGSFIWFRMTQCHSERNKESHTNKEQTTLARAAKRLRLIAHATLIPEFFYLFNIVIILGGPDFRFNDGIFADPADK